MPRVLAALCLILGFSVLGYAQAPPSYALARIEANGLNRFSVADLTRLSGLKVGQPVGPAELDAAAKQVVSTGLFKSARYRVTTEAGQLTLAFDVVEETDWSVPVILDNFIWMPDTELNAAILDAVPAYAGTAPLSGPVIDVIGRALTGVLRRHNISAEIDYRAAGKLDGSDRKHVFSVAKPAPQLCGLRIEGAMKIKESELLKLVPDIVGRPYSRSYLAEYSKNSLAQTYQRRGYWRVALQPPAVTAGTNGGCTGALATIRIDEGMAYRLGPTEWTGNTAIAKGALDRLVGVVPDVLMEPSVMRARVAAIRDAYRRVGYLQQTANLEPVFDDATGRAHLRGAIVEGPQFRVGTFSVEGLSATEADVLKRNWKLKTGDVFDASYLATFQQRAASLVRPPGRALVLQTTTHEDTKRVDVLVKPRN